MKKKAKETKAAKKLLSEKPKDVPRQGDEEKPFDFGGIPDRNIKKNLGCG